MNKWMKWIAAAMALLFALSVAGCNKNQSAASQPAATAAPSEGGETAAPEAQPESAAPADEAEPTAAPTNSEQPANPEQPVNQETTATQSEEEATDETSGLEYDAPVEDDGPGTPPIVTVTWETYESMSDTEKAAYEACFSNQNAFDIWADEAMNSLDMEELDFYDGSLNLKQILSILTGEDIQ